MTKALNVVIYWLPSPFHNDIYLETMSSPRADPMLGLDMKMRSNQNYKVLCMYFDVIFTVFCCILGLWNYELRKKKLRFF